VSSYKNAGKMKRDKSSAQQLQAMFNQTARLDWLICGIDAS